MQERSNTVTDASVSEIGQPVRGSSVCEKPAAVLLDKALRIARGRDRQAVQGDDRFTRGPVGRVQRHPPGRPIRLGAAAAQFAADLDQMIGEAALRKRIRHQVDRKAFRDRGQIELHATRLHDGAPA